MRIRVYNNENPKAEAQEILDGKRPPETSSLDVIDELLWSNRDVTFFRIGDDHTEVEIPRLMAIRLRAIGQDIR